MQFAEHLQRSALRLRRHIQGNRATQAGDQANLKRQRQAGQPQQRAQPHATPVSKHVPGLPDVSR